MDKTIKLILLVNNERLISEIEEVAATVPGEPDCKLINPYGDLGKYQSLSLDARSHKARCFHDQF